MSSDSSDHRHRAGKPRGSTNATQTKCLTPYYWPQPTGSLRRVPKHVLLHHVRQLPMWLSVGSEYRTTYFVPDDPRVGEHDMAGARGVCWSLVTTCFRTGLETEAKSVRDVADFDGHCFGS